ncbi:hypothetical protein DS745_06555 [Anaerobacillus alkaliphilus]|uniref:histidine kinase n=1 Tax=Anaerobacillus alkaliphilus TaxID=1548597 RepID=A0A4Q0VUE4_9BACI|nr:ATP-binding protein [Anaerobacillus alkaliphilus]RXJ02360.1 hypothetical protein DS745_06555 [Anaerobacillus alkaliphilus]
MGRKRRDIIFYFIIVVLSLLVAFYIGRISGLHPILATSFFIMLVITVMLSIYLYILWRERLNTTVVDQIKAVADNPNGINIATVDGYEGIIQSVRKLQRDLTEGEKLRNQMVADVAHELRTPISIFKGQLESIVEGAIPLTRESLLPLLDETSRMSKLILDLRQLSLAETGHLKLERTWVHFDNMMEEIISILDVEAEEKEIRLKLVGATNSEVYCDLARLKQVFINLIGNAIRYTATNGNVEVHIKKLEDTVEISIIDNGQGIPIEYLPYIFQRFYRIEESRSRDYGGMGLGLAIAKEFVVAHGGEITVDSELEVGTTFLVQLPIFPLS